MTIIQQSLLGQWVVFGCSLDYVLATTMALCMLAEIGMALSIAFIAGLVYGGVAGVNVTHYIISFLCALLVLHYTTKLEIEHRAITIIFFGFLASCITKLILLFLAPPAKVKKTLC